ncbi:hypothetical protein ES706_01558 [subsurface metagenome]|nr:hypothetical protein [Hadesarchaea archaeon]
MGKKINRAVENLFLQEKPLKALILLKSENKPLYTAIISKEIDCTYAHTLNVLAELEKLKLVSFKETGRIKLVNLTELGEEAAAVLENFIDLLRLGDAEAEVNQIYEREIKGRLRAEINKKAISRQLEKHKENLKRLSEGRPQNVLLFSKKLLKKVEEVAAEALGYPSR